MIKYFLYIRKRAIIHMKSGLKKILAVFCTLCIAVGVTSCGEDGGKGGNSKGSGASSVVSYNSPNGTAVSKIVANNNLEKAKVPAASSKVNASEIFKKLKYVPQMFYGCYAIDGCYSFPCNSQSLTDYHTDMDYWSADNICSKAEDEVTKIPFRIEAGPCTLASDLSVITSHYWMRMYFQTESRNVEEIMGSYTVVGNKLTFTPVKSYKYNKDTDSVDYELSDKKIEYTFSFHSPNLTISLGGKSVTLTARGLAENYDELEIDSYLSAKSDSIANIQHFDIYLSDTVNHFDITAKKTDVVSDVINNAVGEFSDNGLFTFGWNDTNGSSKVYQYAYFFCEGDGLILTDGSKNYNYNDSYSMHNQALLGSSVTTKEAEKLADLDEQQIAVIVEKRTNLLTDLQSAFEKANINVKVDKESGEIMLDSTILFGYDSSQLSDDGKKFLNKFLKAYSSVILGENYKGFVSKILVEGHTDSSGTYEYNKTLSQSRADNVKEYCLSSSTGLNKEMIKQLSGLMQSVGRSSDELIVDKKGKEDAKASRRVTFRFTINLNGV